MRTFRMIVLTPAGKPEPSLAIAASRAGELGVLNLEYSRSLPTARESIEHLTRHSRCDFGIKLDGQSGDFLFEMSSYLAEFMPERLHYIILTSGPIQNLRKFMRTFHDLGLFIFYESICLRQAQIGKELGADGIIVKGHEAGGKVGEETSFVLLQKVLSSLSLPVFVHGGVGLHTAVSCYAAGAEGIVLDSQLLLTRESPLPKEVKFRLASMDGSEVTCLGERLGAPYRVYSRPNLPILKELQAQEERLCRNDSLHSPSTVANVYDRLSTWRELICQQVGWQSLEKDLFILGQDVSFASSLARRFGTVGGILQGIRQSIDSHLRAVMHSSSSLTDESTAAAGMAGDKEEVQAEDAVSRDADAECGMEDTGSLEWETTNRAINFPFREGSKLARSHGTRYPIVQGPMARISDVPEFATQVAAKGALPFIELAMMRGKNAKSLLERCEKALSGLPWGVGILGFIPLDLFKEQGEAIMAHRPKFVLIAGGKAEQVKSFERQGIPTYIHCPSPGMLKLFLREGLKRFIFEGLECGGHLGPRSSFTLWESSLEVLLDFLGNRQQGQGAGTGPALQSSSADASAYQVLFAGGIHDARSSLMVSVLAAPLAELGVQVGVQIGSAYLFTEEAVSSGAIVREFQQQALASRGTIRLETGHGYVTRCLSTPFTQLFIQERQKMLSEGRSVEEIRNALEELNLGRLRIAAKGIDRSPGGGADPSYVPVSGEDQKERGLYMIGQIAALRDQINTIQELHQSICRGGEEELRKLVHGTWSRVYGSPKDTGSWQPVTASEYPALDGQHSNFRNPPVAIIGMACILPKAPDVRTYWSNILDRVNAIEEIPPDRWDWRLYYHTDRKAKDKIYSRWGGFIDDVPFDPMDYGMPPNTLRSIEPLHLLTLEVVREAMKDAGYLNRSFNRDRTSVILGAGGGVADLGITYSIRSFLPLMEHMSALRAPDGPAHDKAMFDAEKLIARLNSTFSNPPPVGENAKGAGQRAVSDHGRPFFPEWTEDSFPGILMNVAAGRVANRFDLGGANFTVDAACASSMAAVYLAMKELQTYSSDMVVVGGSDTMQNPFTYLCFSKTQALSPTGQSRPLDESADGIVLGEGVAIVVLKRLEDAERDGDRIYAVIKAVGSSSDGRDKCLTAPRPEGQIQALRRAYAQAGVSPATIGLIEAHGTGTVAGDRAEVQALSKVFKDASARRQSCAIGSVKSMIGHTKCTAGVAGLIKVALALKTKVLPPTLGVNQPNRKANFEQSPFYVNTEARPWLNAAESKEAGSRACPHPRRAGVSAFGFGGTNFHAVLEEYIEDLPRQVPEMLYQKWPGELFLWEAKSKNDLLDLLKTMRKTLDAGAGTSADLAKGHGRPLTAAPFAPSTLADLASSQWEQMKSVMKSSSMVTEGSIAAKETPAASQRPSNGFRLAVVATSIEDLQKKIEKSIEVLSSAENDSQKPASGNRIYDYYDPRGIYLAGPTRRVAGKIAFLFPGQGAQYPGMAKDLVLHFPEARSCFERVDQIYSRIYSMNANACKSGNPAADPEKLSDYIFPLPAFSEEDTASQKKNLTRTSIAQPAIGAVSMALCHVLRGLEVYPDMTAGHSYGEYVALWAAGALSEESLLRVSEARGRIIEEAQGVGSADTGTMAALRASEEAIPELIAGIKDVWIANYNSPQQIVISGTKPAVQKVIDRCAGRGIEARMLDVSCAFHSPLVTPAREKFAEFLSTLPLNEPEIAVYSNTTAYPHSTDPARIKDQLVRHLVSSVRFRHEIEAMYESGARIFVEVGPRSILSRLVTQIFPAACDSEKDSEKSSAKGEVQGSEKSAGRRPQDAHSVIGALPSLTADGQDRPILSIALDQPGRPGLLQLQHCLGQLFVQGASMNLDRLHSGRNANDMDWIRPGHRSSGRTFTPTTWFIRGDRIHPLQQKVVRNSRPLGRHFQETGNGEARREMPPKAAGSEKSSTGYEVRQAEQIARHTAQDLQSSITAKGKGHFYASREEMPKEAVENRMRNVECAMQDAENRSQHPAPGNQAAQERDKNMALHEEATQDKSRGNQKAVFDRTDNAGAEKRQGQTQGPFHLHGQHPRSDAGAFGGESLTRSFPQGDFPAIADGSRIADGEPSHQLGGESQKGYFMPAAEDQVMIQFQEIMTRFLDTQKEIMLRYIQNRGQDSATGTGCYPYPSSGTALTEPWAGRDAHGSRVERANDKTLMPDTGYLPLDQGSQESFSGGQAFDASSPAPEAGYPTAAFDHQAPGHSHLTPHVDEQPPKSSYQAPDASFKAPKTDEQEFETSSIQTDGAQESEKLNEEKIRDVLLNIVSERTGYPHEMLDLNLNMEADLGIDSIKRVEILGSFQREFSASMGQSMEQDMESLSGAKTLQEIIDWVVRKTPQTDADISHSLSGPDNSPGESTVPEDPVPDAGYAESSKETSPDAGGIQRYILEKVEFPCICQGQAVLDKSRVVVITEDQERKLARCLADALKGQGYEVALIRMANAKEEHEPEHLSHASEALGNVPVYGADLGSCESVEAVLNIIRQKQGRIGGLIHLYPFASSGQALSQMDLSQWRQRLRLEVKSLFYCARALEPDLRMETSGQHPETMLMAVTSMGGLFGSVPTYSDRTFSPSQGGCAGLIKSLKAEWPEVNLRAVDLDPREDADRLVHYLLKEMHCRGEGASYVEAGYWRGSRFTLRPKAAPLKPHGSASLSKNREGEGQPGFAIESSWVILVTGGARGITADVTRELARRYRPVLILAGSSPLPKEEEDFLTTGSLQEVKSRVIQRMKQEGEEVTPARVEARYRNLCKAAEIRASIGAIKKQGARVHYYQVDVRDDKALAGFIDHLYETFGRIDGVIHGAGIIEDKLIKDKTVESFDRVFDTKVDSAFVLSRKLRFDSLKFLVFFSSVAARFGNRGQADYAAANEVMNKLAIYLDDGLAVLPPGQNYSSQGDRSANFPRIVSINWGPWENSNMVPPALQAEFLKHGVQLISRSFGPMLLDQELHYGREGEIILGGGGWEASLDSRGGRRKDEHQKMPDHGCATGGGEYSSRAPEKEVRGMVFPLFAPGIAFPPNEEGVIEIVRELDTARDLYLWDHRLDGKPVLPMTMALELMVEVASLGWPDWYIDHISDLRVWQGIIVSKPAKVRIVATPSRSPGEAGAQMVLKVEIQNTDKVPRCHYSIVMEMTRLSSAPEGGRDNGDESAAHVAPSIQLDWQPPALLDARPFPMSIEDAYQKMLFHGPLMQGITEVHEIGINGIDGILVPSDPRQLLTGSPSGDWLIDPVIMDSGLQMIILWSRTYWDMMPLPSRFRRFRISAPLSGKTQPSHKGGREDHRRIHFRGRILPQSVGGSSLANGILHADLAFFNEEGVLIALLEDMEAACSRALNRLAEKAERIG
ncbi:MAG: SDR family oxidoreductase [bacterium]